MKKLTITNSLFEPTPQILTLIEEANRKKWDYEQYVTAGQQARVVGDYKNWITGMLAYEVEKKYGTDEEFAKDCGIAKASLQTYRWVYKKFMKADSKFKPNSLVPFVVLQIAARTENPVELVKKFEKEGVSSIEKATVVVKQMKGQEIHRRPRIGVKWCEETKKWRITFKKEDLPTIDWPYVHQQIADYITKED